MKRQFCVQRRVVFMAFFLLSHQDTPMRVLLTLSGLILLCASVVTGADTLIGPARAQVHMHALSEPAGLVVLGAGFVLLAHQVRKQKQ